MQAELFARETADFRHQPGVRDGDAGNPRPVSPARRQPSRLTLRQRRALQRKVEAQQRYNATRSHTALQRLKDAVTDALRLGV